jgi:hypothetical protein
MTGFPLPGTGCAVVAVPAPGDGPGYWAGASSAALDEDGSLVVGYRVRNGHDGIDQTVIARSPDGETLTTVATLDQSRFGAQWMERPAVVRTEQGRWRLYVCLGTPESKHWWIEVLEADDPAEFDRPAGTVRADRRLAHRRRSLSRRAAARRRRWLPHLVRGQTARREP